MALRAVKPKMVKKRLKAFVYGDAKVGKTTLAIQFPKPYLIDTEKGSENNKYVRLLEEAGGVVYRTSDFDEAIQEIKSLLSETHEYKTLVIDPLTILYDDILDKCEEKCNKSGANSSGFARHYGMAAKRMKQLNSLLLRLDMNVIITSHAKKEYGEKMVVLGTTFDCYKKMDYLFDLIIEVKKLTPQNRIAIVKGSRLDEFVLDDSFPCSYEQIAERYSREILEKDCIAAELASDTQIKEVNRLIKLLKVPDEMVEKWLKKAESSSFDEMKETDIAKIIEYLNLKIQGDAA